MDDRSVGVGTKDDLFAPFVGDITGENDAIFIVYRTFIFRHVYHQSGIYSHPYKSFSILSAFFVNT